MSHNDPSHGLDSSLCVWQGWSGPSRSGSSSSITSIDHHPGHSATSIGKANKSGKSGSGGNKGRYEPSLKGSSSSIDGDDDSWSGHGWSTGQGWATSASGPSFDGWRSSNRSPRGKRRRLDGKKTGGGKRKLTNSGPSGSWEGGWSTGSGWRSHADAAENFESKILVWDGTRQGSKTAKSNKRSKGGKGIGDEGSSSWSAPTICEHEPTHEPAPSQQAKRPTRRPIWGLPGRPAKNVSRFFQSFFPRFDMRPCTTFARVLLFRSARSGVQVRVPFLCTEVHEKSLEESGLWIFTQSAGSGHVMGVDFGLRSSVAVGAEFGARRPAIATRGSARRPSTAPKLVGHNVATLESRFSYSRPDYRARYGAQKVRQALARFMILHFSILHTRVC